MRYAVYPHPMPCAGCKNKLSMQFPSPITTRHPAAQDAPRLITPAMHVCIHHHRRRRHHPLLLSQSLENRNHEVEAKMNSALELLALHPLSQVSLNIIRGIGDLSSRLTVPGPHVGVLGLELAVHHLDDVLTNDGEELPGVERAARRDVEVLAAGMRGNKKVVPRRGRVPVVLCGGVSISRAEVYG